MREDDEVTTPAAVANFFLDSADKEGSDIDQMKLMKLVYYAYAWYAGYYHKELFREDIKAWKYGPVIESLYREFKRYGFTPISKRIKVLDIKSSREINFVPAEITNETHKDFLNVIWAAYKENTGIDLSNETHLPGEPWTIIHDAYREKGKDLKEENPSIRFELIEEIFSEKIQKRKKEIGGE